MSYVDRYTGNIAATTLTKVIDIPTSKSEKWISSLSLYNTNSSAEAIDLQIVRADTTVEYLLPADYSLAAGTMKDDIAQGRKLYPGDAVWANTTTASKVQIAIQLKGKKEA